MRTKKVFIYLTVIAVILGFIGIFKLTDDLTGKIVIEDVKDWEKYSIEEISEHNSEKDCWLSAEGKIYDITLFLQILDAGLENSCGGKADLSWLDDNIKELLKNYQIGILD